MSRYHYPPKSSSQQSLFLRKKASTRREQNGYLSAKVYKIFEMPLLFRELFREKSKKIDVGAHKKGKRMLENKRKSGKQLLTLLTPVVFPPFLFGKVALLNPAFTSASIPKQELYAPSSHPR